MFEYICTKQLCQRPEIFKPFVGQYHILLLEPPSHNQSLYIKNYLHKWCRHFTLQTHKIPEKLTYASYVVGIGRGF
jgi:hypothetical protein